MKQQIIFTNMDKKLNEYAFRSLVLKGFSDSSILFIPIKVPDFT